MCGPRGVMLRHYHEESTTHILTETCATLRYLSVGSTLHTTRSAFECTVDYFVLLFCIICMIIYIYMVMCILTVLGKVNCKINKIKVIAIFFIVFLS